MIAGIGVGFLKVQVTLDIRETRPPYAQLTAAKPERWQRAHAGSGGPERLVSQVAGGLTIYTCPGARVTT